MSTPIAHPILNWPLSDMRSALGLQGISAADTAGQKASRILTDSRAVQAGDVFIALRGDRFDAHDFVADVVARGAVAVIVDRDVPVQGPLWRVDDTRRALGLLAKAWRARFDIPLVAVTGSNGKTTTKEMIAAILRSEFGEGHVLSTRGNLNNDVGVPHTLFELNASHRVAVVEMGMNHPGEIAWLAEMAAPTVALVNNAQREHQEFMKTVEAVARENGCVISALTSAGVAVYPAADEHTAIWNQLAGARRTLRFAATDDNAKDASATVRWADKAGALALQMTGPWIENLYIDLQLPGAHNARNALAAALCAWAAGCGAGAIVNGLNGFEAVSGRMQRVAHPAGGVLINDTYNANPDSVGAAIAALKSLPAPRCLVLGDMGEVGEQGEAFHRELGLQARVAGIDALHTVGTLAIHSSQAFGAGATHHSDIDTLISSVKTLAQQQPGSIVVKGSRFMKMERVIQAISGGSAQEGGHAA